ncbi:MAG: HEAT repeat domain-containing protein [Spirochaetes bacterium]|nr:HEAT repeat domain-containing protein [Spirochaetota bacterium]
MMKFICIVCFLLISGVFAHSQNTESLRRETIQYGTETEIVSLIQALINEKADYLDDELTALIDTSKNQKILNGVFAFFGERGKNGLEERAIRVVVERDYEANETVHSAVEYLGRVKSQDAVPVIMELLNTGERRFFSTAFRALGRASSGGEELADEAAEYLIDFYTYRDPGDDNKREVITAIGTTGSSKGVSMLAEIASDTNERIPLRIAALDALSKIGDNAGLEAILGCVSTNDPNVRSAAVGALGPFSGEEVDKAILDAFRDSYYRTRIAAAQASRDRKFAEAVPYLKYRAERDEVPNVKDEAIRALGAIANEEANSVLENLFAERKNSDRIRIIAAEMVMKNEPDKNLRKLIIELDDAKTKNQTALYNGLLKVIGETVVTGDKTDIESITRRFLRNGTIIEKSYGLDMAVNNSLTGLSAEITVITKEKNESISRKAARTAEKLGIQILNE